MLGGMLVAFLRWCSRRPDNSFQVSRGRLGQRLFLILDFLANRFILKHTKKMPSSHRRLAGSSKNAI